MSRCLVVVGEVAEEEEGEHVVAEVVGIHLAAELVRDIPKNTTKLRLVLFDHSCFCWVYWAR